ncbi:MAG: hypothetical protein LBI56_04495 [Puniceicoccales bacterium]|nr:hypothetical protein [Puniceicoccales bacterium]
MDLRKDEGELLKEEIGFHEEHRKDSTEFNTDQEKHTLDISKNLDVSTHNSKILTVELKKRNCSIEKSPDNSNNVAESAVASKKIVNALTLRDGESKKEAEQEIKDPIFDSKTFISNTSIENSAPSNDDVSGKFENSKFVTEFENLKICEDKKQTEKLNKLVLELHSKSPEMLAKIFDNCKWLKGKMKDSFIYAVALARIEMELKKIFPQEEYDKLPKGLYPEITIMWSLWSLRTDPIFNDDIMKVLEKSRENFDKMLDDLPPYLESESL